MSVEVNNFIGFMNGAHLCLQRGANTAAKPRGKGTEAPFPWCTNAAAGPTNERCKVNELIQLKAERFPPMSVSELFLIIEQRT